jgi:hypothetical protein
MDAFEWKYVYYAWKEFDHHTFFDGFDIPVHWES